MVRIAIFIVAAVGSILTSKAHKLSGREFLCQNTHGTCVYIVKYKAVPFGGQVMYCNDGAGSGICNNLLRVVVNND